MGKGDKKSRRGKITNRSYGVRRPRKKAKVEFVKPEEPKPKTPAKKAPTKKATPKAKAASKAKKEES
jgi:30S ribosomal protein S31